MVSCSDVCELVQEMLNGQGFTFDDNEASHEDMIQALQQCTLVKDGQAKEVHVVVGVYSGVTSEVKVCRTQGSALAHYDRIREAYDIHTDEEAESPHDCQWFTLEIEE